MKNDIIQLAIKKTFFFTEHVTGNLSKLKTKYIICNEI